MVSFDKDESSITLRLSLLKTHREVSDFLFLSIIVGNKYFHRTKLNKVVITLTKLNYLP